MNGTSNEDNSDEEYYGDDHIDYSKLNDMVWN